MSKNGSQLVDSGMTWALRKIVIFISTAVLLRNSLFSRVDRKPEKFIFTKIFANTQIDRLYIENPASFSCLR